MERESASESLIGRQQADAIGSSGGGDSRPTAVLILSTLVAACGTFTFGCVIGYSSPAESEIRSELGLSVAQYSVFGSMITIGGMIGAISSGRIAELLGRRITMWICDIFCMMGWLAIAFAQGAWSLYLGRLSLGFGIGLISYAGPVYIAEITPKNLRGALMSFEMMMIGFASSVMYLIGSVINWRALALIGSLPCALQLLGLFFVPESPRWLAKKNRGKQFEASLRHLRGENADISEEAADIKDYTEKIQLILEDGILDLFQRKYTRSLIVGVGLLALQQLGGINGFSFYTTAIFDTAGFPSGVGLIAVALVQISMNVVGIFLIDKFGRRPLLMVSAAGTCLGCLLTGLSFFFQDLEWGNEVTPDCVLIGILVYFAFFSLGMTGIPWIIMSEIFPINVKGSAGSLCNLVYWLCSWLVSYTFYMLFEWNSAVTLIIFASICGSTVLFVWMLVPETKRRTLEEIHVSITQ